MFISFNFEWGKRSYGGSRGDESPKEKALMYARDYGDSSRTAEQVLADTAVYLEYLQAK